LQLWKSRAGAKKIITGVAAVWGASVLPPATPVIIFWGPEQCAPGLRKIDLPQRIGCRSKKSGLLDLPGPVLVGDLDVERAVASLNVSRRGSHSHSQGVRGQAAALWAGPPRGRATAGGWRRRSRVYRCRRNQGCRHSGKNRMSKSQWRSQWHSPWHSPARTLHNPWHRRHITWDHR